MRFQNIGLPLSKTLFMYIGKRSSLLTPGRTYMVIDTGEHWHHSFGYGVWFTNDEDPETTDVDYGVFVNEKYFKKNFVKSEER